MGDAALLLWVGFFLGFWTCAVVVMVYRYKRLGKKSGVGSRESGERGEKNAAEN